MIGREKRLRLLNRDPAEFVGGGKVFQAAQAEVFEKMLSGVVGVRATGDFGANGLLDEAAFEKGLHHASDRDAANLLDLGARERLAISDDGESLEGGLRKAGRTDFVPDERLDPRGILRLAGELPRAGHAHKA